MYAAKWTRQIESEFVSALERERPDLRGRLHRRQQFMRASIPDWEVEQDAWEHIVPSLQLPDPTDRHVLAAALAAHADCVVTSNKRHFPDQVVRPLAIEVIDPDTFMVNQPDLNEVTALTAFREMRRRKRNPSLTAVR